MLTLCLDKMDFRLRGNDVARFNASGILDVAIA
jgi:hypothetical protein